MACKNKSTQILNVYKELNYVLNTFLNQFKTNIDTLKTGVDECCTATNTNYQNISDLLDLYIANHQECCDMILGHLDIILAQLCDYPCFSEYILPTTTTTTVETFTTTVETGTTTVETGTTTSAPSPDECDAPTTVTDKGSFYPYIISKYLGTGLGLVTLTYDEFKIPDRFVVEFGGVDVIDTGYVGLSKFQAYLDIAVAGYGDVAGTINATPTGVATFCKTTAEEYAIVKVYAPLSNTKFTFTLSCPEPPCTTTTTTIPPTTTTTTTLGCFNWILSRDTEAPAYFDVDYCDAPSALVIVTGDPVTVCAFDVVTFDEDLGTATLTATPCPTTTTTTTPVTTTTTTEGPTTTTTTCFDCTTTTTTESTTTTTTTVQVTTTTTTAGCVFHEDYTVPSELNGYIDDDPDIDFTATLEASCNALYGYKYLGYTLNTMYHAISKYWGYGDYWRVGDFVFDTDTCELVPTGYYIVNLPGNPLQVIYINSGVIVSYPSCPTTTTTTVAPTTTTTTTATPTTTTTTEEVTTTTTTVEVTTTTTTLEPTTTTTTTEESTTTTTTTEEVTTTTTTVEITTTTTTTAEVTTTTSTEEVTTTTTTTEEVTTTTTTVYQPEGCVEYGYLYNWYAATDARSIAASGWHMPTNNEWETLQSTIGGTIYGYKLKETGTIYWNSPNTGATNETEFTARAGGNRPGNSGSFGSIKNYGEYKASNYDNEGGTGRSGIILKYNSEWLYFRYTSGGDIDISKRNGDSIRLIKDDSTLEHYTGNDGKEYKTVKIGTQVWMAENLAETLYADLTEIPYVYGDSEWTVLTSGARCAYDNDCDYVGCDEVCPETTTTTTSEPTTTTTTEEVTTTTTTEEVTTTTTTTAEVTTTTTTIYQPEGCVEYGYLYNWYAANDIRNISSSGWRVPTTSDFGNLISYLGGTENAGGKLKETGYTYWDSPNTGATNEVGFNGRGAGIRTSIFSSLKVSALFWSSYNYWGYELKEDNSNFMDWITPEGYYGMSIRLIKDDDTLEHYTGNDGKEYKTVKIGTQVWMAENLAETLYADLTEIPYVYGDSEWTVLTSGARCAYDNDCDYVGCDEVCPTTTTTTEEVTTTTTTEEVTTTTTTTE